MSFINKFNVVFIYKDILKSKGLIFWYKRHNGLYGLKYSFSLDHHFYQSLTIFVFKCMIVFINYKYFRFKLKIKLL